MAQVPKWALKIWQDFTTREFIPLKLLYFFLFGGMMTLFPFLTIQARSLGIMEKELGIIYGIMPVVAIITPPVSGMVADKIGNYKIFMSATSALSGVAALGYLIVPAGRVKQPLPNPLPLELTCGLNSSFRVIHPYKCHYHTSEIQVHMTTCHVNCENTTIVLAQTEDPPVAACRNSPACSLLISYTHLVSITGRLHNNSDQILFPPSDFCSDKDLLESGWYSNTNNNANVTCVVECFGEANTTRLCEKDFYWEDINPILTFVSYTIIRLINGMTLAMSIPLFEGATIAILNKNKGDYGLQKMYANVGSMILTPISGILIDVASYNSGAEDYSSAFYLYFAMKIVSALIILQVDLEFKKPSDRVVKDFKTLLKNVEVVALLVVVFISGICFGFLDTFLFWLLQDLGANKQLMGITVMVGAMCGIPFIIASGAIVSRLGHVNTIIFGFAFYVIRMIGYSLITNPWWCLPFEALECFTVSLMYAAMTTYVGELSTPSTIASLQGLHGGIHFGVGRSAGSLIGGFLTPVIDVRNVFKIMAVICGVTCISYFIINITILKKKTKLRKELQKDKSNSPDDPIENGIDEYKLEESVKSTRGRRNSKSSDNEEYCSTA